MTTPSRRTFLASTAAVALTSTVSAAETDTVPIAVIGCGGMGTNHLKLLAANKRVKLAAVCEVDATRLVAAAKIATDAGHTPKATKDLREVLDDKDIKAVWIATPDHWHAPAAILAADAGKHVYVEKPCSHNVREGRLMIEAAARNKIVMQVGTQARSTKTVQEAMARLKDGAIGDVLAAKAWNSQLRRNLGKVKSSQPPDTLDYDLWQGPVPEAPFYANRVPGMWRFFRDYGAGDIGNDGVHNIDVGVWGLNATVLPNRVAASRRQVLRRRPGVARHAICGVRVRPTRWQAAAVHVRTAHLVAVRAGGVRERQRLLRHEGGAHHRAHGRVEDVRRAEQAEGGDDRRGQPAGPPRQLPRRRPEGRQAERAVEVGHISAGICHLANIATRMRATVEFDPVKEAITNNPEGHSLTKRKYRDKHWAVPKGV